MPTQEFELDALRMNSFWTFENVLLQSYNLAGGHPWTQLAAGEGKQRNENQQFMGKDGQSDNLGKKGKAEANGSFNEQPNNLESD